MIDSQLSTCRQVAGFDTYLVVERTVDTVLLGTAVSVKIQQDKAPTLVFNGRTQIQ
jgi:hypothetical protein